MKRSMHILAGASALTIMLLGASSARATLMNVDQIIYQPVAGTTVTPSLLSGTIDVSVSGSVLTILLTNTSPDAAFVGGVAPATMLLTGFGIQLGSTDILSGTVEVNGGSTVLNFDGGQSTSNISNQWLYANSAIDGYNLSGVLAVDAVTSSVNNGGGTRFAGPPPGSIDGPGYGALSGLETEFGASTPAVLSTIKFTLNLDGAVTEAGIDAGNVVLAFGSPTTVPEPATLAMLSGGLVSLAGFRRRRSRV